MPHRILARLVAVTLLLGTGLAHAQTVELETPLITATAGGSVLMDVSVTAGGTGAPNGFTIEWMTEAQFRQIGGEWPATATHPFLRSAAFLGTPTLNTADGTVTFALDPGEMAMVQLGDFFDETGVMTANSNEELAAGTLYVFRVKANGPDDPFAAFSSSRYSGTHYCQTKPPGGGYGGGYGDDDDCTESEGHWRSHPSQWPVSSLRLGNVVYSKTQLLSIMNKSARGNGLLSMAHELIAAKLNVYAGAIASPKTSNAIAAADALIGNLVVPPLGAGFLKPEHTNGVTDHLEDFSSDDDEHECRMPTNRRASTWGAVKAMYR